MMPYKKSISEHGMFPSVYVWVRELEAWKLHPYNSIALYMFLFILFIYQTFAHLAQNLEYLSNF